MSQAIHARVSSRYRFPAIWKAYSRYLVEKVNGMFDRARMIDELKGLGVKGNLSEIVSLFENCYKDLSKIKNDPTILMPEFCLSQHYKTTRTSLAWLLEKTGVKHEHLIEGFANPCDTQAPKCCSLFGGDYHDFFSLDLSSFPRETVWLINPPFTETLLFEAAKKLKDAGVSYIFICPSWDCEANRILEADCSTQYPCTDFEFPEGAGVARGSNPATIVNKGCKAYVKIVE